jgi:hypothetical protein
MMTPMTRPEYYLGVYKDMIGRALGPSLKGEAYA